MWKSVILATIVAAIGLGKNAEGFGAAAGNENGVLYVSIIDMIVRPEQLPEGRDRIAIIGFLGEDGSLLHLTEEYAKFPVDPAAIRVAAPSDGPLPKECTGRYVQVTGTWRRGPWEVRGFASIEKVEVIGEDEVLKNEDSNSELTLLAVPVSCWKAEPDSE